MGVMPFYGILARMHANFGENHRKLRMVRSSKRDWVLNRHLSFKEWNLSVIGGAGKIKNLENSNSSKSAVICPAIFRICFGSFFNIF